MDSEEFLGFTSRDKAGLGWDGWKDAEIFIYEGVVLEDTDNNKCVVQLRYMQVKILPQIAQIDADQYF